MLSGTMEVAQIIDQVRERYCQCRSYRDEGYVEMRREDKLEGLVEFKTFYKQPNQFRFDYKRNAPMGALMSASIRRNRNECINHAPEFGADMQHVDLNAAMAGATGVSLGVSLYVPALVMPGIRCHRLIDYEMYTLIEFDPTIPDDTIALDVAEEGTQLRLFINKNDFSISSIRKETQQSDDEIEAILERVPDDLKELLIAQMEHKSIKEELTKPVLITYNYKKVQFDSDISEEYFDLRFKS